MAGRDLTLGVGRLETGQRDASLSARLSGGLVATLVAGPFCAIASGL